VAVSGGGAHVGLRRFGYALPDHADAGHDPRLGADGDRIAAPALQAHGIHRPQAVPGRTTQVDEGLAVELHLAVEAADAQPVEAGVRWNQVAAPLHAMHIAHLRKVETARVDVRLDPADHRIGLEAGTSYPGVQFAF